MKNTLKILVLGGLALMARIGTADEQKPDIEHTSNLSPKNPKDQKTFVLEPQQTGKYNVNIKDKDVVGSVKYVLDKEKTEVSVPTTGPLDPDLIWVWKYTGGDAVHSFVFEVANTIWEDKKDTVTVECEWKPESGTGGKTGTGKTPKKIPGRADGLAIHKEGTLKVTDLAILDPPDYLCINETLELSAWVMRPDDFPWDFLDSVDAEWEVTPTGNGTLDPSAGSSHSVVFTPLETGDVTITATVPGTDGPITDSITITIIKVDIKRDGNMITDTTTDVMVGEKINLAGEVIPGALTITSKQWNIPVTTVKTYSQTVANGVKTDLAQTDFQQDNISYHWIDGADARDVKYTVVVGDTAFDGKATFNVKRPTSTLTSQTTAEQPPVGVRDEGFGQELIFGSTASPGITWKANVTTPANGAGKIAFVQLINSDMRMTLDDGSKYKNTPAGKYILDPDEDGNIRQLGETNIGNSDTKDHEREDIPSSYLESLDDQCQQMFNKELESFSRNHQFQLFLMYKPNTANSIWVTLRLLHWHYSGGATKNLQTDVWSLDAGATSSQNPGSNDSTTLPEWNDNWENIGFVPDN